MDSILEAKVEKWGLNQLNILLSGSIAVIALFLVQVFAGKVGGAVGTGYLFAIGGN